MERKQMFARKTGNVARSEPKPQQQQYDRTVP